MAKLNYSISAIISIFFLLTKINPFCYARTLPNNQTPTHHYSNHPKIKFLMQNVLNSTNPSANPTTTKFPTQIPFPKPIGFFPPKNGIPLPQSIDFPNNGLSFPIRAALQELEFGSMTEIDEQLFEGASLIGKAQGIFVPNSENETNYMVAMSANFGEDGLKFFGVYGRDAVESHIAVIGGIGKYQDANGYAVIKAIHGSFNYVQGEENTTQKLLSFNVYLS